MGLWEKFLNQWHQKTSALVVGLDPDLKKVPPEFASPGKIPEFFGEIVRATAPFAAGYKPNTAFFLALGDDGIKILRATVERISSLAPDIPVILDGKFNDVGHTAEKYAQFASAVGADAVVINPYLGRDSIVPFLERDLDVILLCATSNPSFADLQGLDVGGKPLYVVVAEISARWSEQMDRRFGLVVGATHPETFGEIRRVAPKLPFLVPGIGVQGGTIDAAFRATMTEDGIPPMVVSARSVIYASRGPDFRERAGEKGREIRDAIKSLLGTG